MSELTQISPRRGEGLEAALPTDQRLTGDALIAFAAS
jgi:hypothetical protein